MARKKSKKEAAAMAKAILLIATAIFCGIFLRYKKWSE